MPTEHRGAAELRKQKGIVVGHGAAPHPLFAEGFVSIFIVRTDQAWVVCLSEGKVAYNWTEARKGLGAEILGTQFAPFARRGVGRKTPFAELRRVVEESFKEQDFTFEWWGGAVDDG